MIYSQLYENRSIEANTNLFPNDYHKNLLFILIDKNINARNNMILSN
jgi:hypothetical protein